MISPIKNHLEESTFFAGSANQCYRQRAAIQFSALTEKKGRKKLWVGHIQWETEEWGTDPPGGGPDRDMGVPLSPPSCQFCILYFSHFCTSFGSDLGQEKAFSAHLRPLVEQKERGFILHHFLILPARELQ